MPRAKVRALVVPVLGLKLGSGHDLPKPKPPKKKLVKDKPKTKKIPGKSIPLEEFNRKVLERERKHQGPQKVKEVMVKAIRRQKVVPPMNRYVLQYPISGHGALPELRWWVMAEPKPRKMIVEAGPFRTETEAIDILRQKEVPA